MKLRKRTPGGGTKRRMNKGPRKEFSGVKKGPRDLGMKYGNDTRRSSSREDEKPKSGPAFGRARIPVSETFKKKTGAQKLVASLQNKKDRDARKLFLVEGEKSFLEAIESSYELHTVFATHMFLATYPELAESIKQFTNIVDASELSGMGTFASNMMVIGVFHQKQVPPLVVADEIVLALDDVNDPGNLGTLIRIADWYGIRKVICSKSTVDVYNPKTISAAKGSFTRVDVYYKDLEDFFRSQHDLPIFAADLEGKSVHNVSFPSRGVLLLGNESHGIDHTLKEIVTESVTIPRFGHAESLNVAVAGAIILDSWKRK
jgi:TrmH family RNA methyltransferase